MAKDALAIHDELETEIEELEPQVAVLLTTMQEAINAYDAVNNKLTALKKAKKEMLAAPGVAAVVGKREPKP